MRPGIALALVASVLAAGCSGLAGFGTDAPATPTATPAPVPDSASAGTGPAPGIGPDRLVSVRDLSRAHDRALRARSYRLVRTVTVVSRDGPNRTTTPATADGSATGGATATGNATATATAAQRGGSGAGDALARVSRTAVVAPGERAYTFSRDRDVTAVYSVSAPSSEIDIWYRDGNVSSRFVDRRRVVRRRNSTTRRGGPVDDLPLGRELVGQFAAFAPRVVGERAVDGDPAVRLRADRLADPGALQTPALVRDPHDARLRATVDRRGIVRRLTVTYDARFRGRPVRVRYRLRVTEVGSATVTPPDWVGAGDRVERVLPKRMAGLAETGTWHGDVPVAYPGVGV